MELGFRIYSAKVMGAAVFQKNSTGHTFGGSVWDMLRVMLRLDKINVPNLFVNKF